MRQEWTINSLADETLMDRRTLKKILADVRPARTDGKSEFFWMSDFIDALKGYFGTKSRLDAARLKRAEGEADDIVISVEKQKAVLVEMAHLCRRLEPKYIAMKQMIEGFENLTAEQKDELLHGLHAIHSALGEGQGTRQSVGDSPAGADPETPAEA